MTHIGKITTYKSETASGTLTPNNGGSALTFERSNLRQQGHEPRPGQTYTYELAEDAKGARRAVNMQLIPRSFGSTPRGH